ncbi:hypothetical protein X963_6068 [Burkholderia pseudomallei MSHR7498]|nr:hypothetical protein X963_6068 [Burkholderia pseudomallei MSHR7498]
MLAYGLYEAGEAASLANGATFPAKRAALVAAASAGSLQIASQRLECVVGRVDYRLIGKPAWDSSP